MEKTNKDHQGEVVALRAENASLRSEKTFTSDILSEIGLGLWSFEIDEGVPPRMYGNLEMDTLVGCDGLSITPEEYYNVWHRCVDKDHLHAVDAVVKRIIAGEFAEVSYPYHHPTRGTIYVVCGGRRDFSYTKGLRIVGRHQEITNLINLRAGDATLEVIATKASEAMDRADKASCINKSLGLLVAERDFSSALLTIMGMWCKALGAQWCFAGRWDGSAYHVLQSYVADGEEPVYDAGTTVRCLRDFDDPDSVHGADDYCPMPEFQQHPYWTDFTHTAQHPDTLRRISSCYSHVIRHNGQRWGSLVLMFRERHALTRNEEVFFKAAVRGIELSLIRQGYEAEIAADRDRALAAEKARSLFFSSVSHDIRTPLNAIVGFAELLEGGGLEKAEHDRYVAAIRSSGKVLARLVNDILDLSKLESGKLEIINEPTDIQSLAHDLAATMALARGRKEIEFKAEIAPMPHVYIDPQRVRQLLYNLLSNAYKYTERGTILLRTTWQDGRLTLAVSDTGKGISQEDIDRVLLPFVQLADRNQRDGTGLGLSICQRLAQLMGGELTIASELGKGSTFAVVLSNVQAIAPTQTPAERESSDSAASAEAARVRVPADGALRVLAVDDSPVNLKVLSAMLARIGITDVVTAPDGAAALELLKTGSAFDAVLTDLWMPKLDGEELVREIRKTPAYAKLPVYAVTADVEAQKSYREKGFSGILLKPLTIANLTGLFEEIRYV